MTGGFPAGMDVCSGRGVGTTTSSGVSTLGTAVVSGAANAKGAWTQLSAATVSDSCMAAVYIFTSDTGGIDIGIGAGGSEQPIAKNLFSVGTAGVSSAGPYIFPCAIPAGTRIAARSQCSAATSTGYISLSLWDGAFTQADGYAGIDSIGFSTSTSLGITPVAAAFTQMTASTVNDYAGLIVSWGGTSFTYGNLDIAVGAAGLEQIVIPQYLIAQSNSAGNSGFIPIAIPAGSRMSVRLNSDVIGTAAYVTLHGVYQ